MKKTLKHPKTSAARRSKTRRRGGSLGLSLENTAQIIRKIQAGFRYEAFQNFRKASDLSPQLIAQTMQVPPRTLARRKIQGRLGPAESERLLRMSLVFEKALALFEGDTVAAKQWLLTSQPALGGQTPLEFARTEIGAREVENLIGRLEHGVFI